MCAKTHWLRWHLWIRPLIITLYVLFVLILVPLLIVNAVKDGFNRNDQLILVGGLFVLTSIPVSIWHIVQHMNHFTKPVLQMHIVRILWMVPIYALNAWLGLIFFEKSFYMDCVRECYEAYVIYNFMAYLLNYLNLEMDLEATLELKPSVRHVFPLCYMTPWRMGREFVHHCKHGILQYAWVRLLTTFVSIICELCGVYGESTFSANVAYPYIVTINNLSQFTAMYCLVLFYKANKLELKPMRPLPKFLCIKAVIFFSFFQSVAITFLVYYGFIKNIFGVTESGDDDHKNLSSKLQDFLICVEMFIAAIAHKYSFPHEPFHINIPNYTVDANRTWFQSCWAMCNMSDVQADVTEHFGVVGSSMMRRLRGRNDYMMTRESPTYGGTASSEVDFLIQPTAQQSQQRKTNNEQQPGSNHSAYNRYGTLNHAAASHDGINIVKQTATTKDYSPQFGAAPKTGGTFFSMQKSLTTPSTPSVRHDKSPFSENTTSTTGDTKSTSRSGHGETFTGLTAGGAPGGSLVVLGAVGGGSGSGKLPKSDSTTSDWLSSPTDEMVGIDFNGPDEGNLITFPRD